MSTIARRRLLLTLAAVSIAGLLAMHVLDPVVASIHAPTHVSEMPNADAGLDHHGVIGLCLFMTVAAGLALARFDLTRVAATRPLPGRRARLSAGSKAEIRSGPPLFYRLCVLRL
ncbi:hypothetical protein BH23ACT4_BH23ACT4_16310 [soil metagenome]